MVVKTQVNKKHCRSFERLPEIINNNHLLLYIKQ